MVNLDRRLARPGAELAFSDSGGDGSAVVLTHGAGVDHSMFDAKIPALTEHGYRVIVWHLRGHGQSTLAPGERFTALHAFDDLDALLGECGVDAPVLVGHSLGGNLAQAFARQHAQRVGGVIVLDSTWNAGPLSALERLALRLAAPALAVIPAGRLPRIMAQASATTPEAIARTHLGRTDGAVEAAHPHPRRLERAAGSVGGQVSLPVSSRRAWRAESTRQGRGEPLATSSPVVSFARCEPTGRSGSVIHAMDGSPSDPHPTPVGLALPTQHHHPAPPTQKGTEPWTCFDRSQPERPRRRRASRARFRTARVGTASSSTTSLAYQVVKYRQREGWSHRDLLRLAHPATTEQVPATRPARVS